MIGVVVAVVVIVGDREGHHGRVVGRRGQVQRGMVALGWLHGIEKQKHLTHK